MTIRIAYFSWKGHTRKVAETLSGLLKKAGRDTTLVEIHPEKGFNIGIQAMKAILAMKSPIIPDTTDLTGVDELIIATPIWAGKVPPFVNAYCSAIKNGEGKPFYVVTEMGGRGAEGGISVVRKQLEKRGMRFVSSASTIEKDVDNGTFTKTLETFVVGVGKR
jgi:flavodoxin